MKTSLFYLISLICMMAGVTCHTSGQEGSPINRRESTKLFTDRTMYITGEMIQFSAFQWSETDQDERILYVEMITPDGKKITGGKYLLNHKLASGCLLIPEDMLTGLYYIRAYTRYMRNSGPSSYDYIPLKVINPAKSDILVTIPGTSAVIPREPLISDIFEISGVKHLYKTHEAAGITLQGKNPDAALVKDLNITVVPETSVDHSGIWGTLSEPESPEFSGQYFAETGGISLSGKFIDKDLKTPLTDRVINLSIMGDKDFSGFKTNQNGRFFFNLPDYWGTRDIFLSSSDYSASGEGLFIDNDFCSVPVRLPCPDFMLSPEEKETALNLSVNARITSAYNGNRVSNGDTVTLGSKPFYGEPTALLLMDKFIQLPTLKEYFDELPLEVKVRERKEGKYFKFLYGDAGMMVNDPLVLVDWVAITDINKVLSLVPQNISRIEIVNKPFVKGNLTYGGIISILSRHGDFAGIDLPGSGIFVKYDFLAPACPAEYSVHNAPNLPDSRNTLLWLPDLKTGPDMKKTITFDTPDTPGRYVILLRGVYTDGRVYSQSITFQVVH
jgi:hypothetical protein